jgi:hypothetical protein
VYKRQIQGCLATSGNDDLVAALGEQLSQSGSDSGATSGDDGYKLFSHVLLLI